MATVAQNSLQASTNIINAPPPLVSPTSSLSHGSMRDTFLNMLGEFVALSKTPDFKLSPKSNQYLAAAIRDEIRAEREKRLRETLFEQNYSRDFTPRHTRTMSTNSTYHHSKAAATFSLNPAGTRDKYANNNTNFDSQQASRDIADRRQSLPVINGDNTTPTSAPPLSLFQRVRRLSQRKTSIPKTLDSVKIAKSAGTTNMLLSLPIKSDNDTVVQSIERHHKSHTRHDLSTKRTDNSVATQLESVREHRHCHYRHHSSMGCRRNRRASTTAEDTFTPPTTSSEESIRRKAIRARKQKISVAAMIADAAEETKTSTKHKCSK